MGINELEEQIIDGIKTELGFPVVSVYITDTQIKKLIQKAIRRCKIKACPTRFSLRRVVNGKIDVSDLDVETVRHIYESMSEGGVGVDVFEDYMFRARAGLAGGTMGQGIYNALAHIGNLAELKRLAMYDYEFDAEEKLIYVDNYSGTVTIEYIVSEPVITDLSTEWVAWVEAYTTALCKIAEGRIRGKYRMNNAPFEINADELISEGQTDKAEAEQKLDMALGYYKVMRG